RPLIALIALQSSAMLATERNGNRAPMASLTIRQLDDEVKRRLRLRAARHGRSMEEEARHLLAQHLDAGTAPRAAEETAAPSRRGRASAIPSATEHPIGATLATR